MAQITEAEHTAAFEDADLGEAFEVFIQQRQYFEVLNLTDGIYGELSTIKTSGVFNASSWFHRVDGKYQFEHLEERGELEKTFYKFDTMAEAVAFAAELLATVTDGV